MKWPIKAGLEGEWGIFCLFEKLLHPLPSFVKGEERCLPSEAILCKAMSFVGIGIRAPSLVVFLSTSLMGENVRLLEGANDGPALDGEPVSSDLQCLLEILKAMSKDLHRILKVIRPEPNLVH
ncbi:hypothetical protein AMTR_s00076p00174050 [Amborella trichopoda]|uniref:Uncharacterized protein n=1 Tax=Amborella trichopoda TaxID=13333 RepID=W1PAU6_AMBTC|nr:hypothetical protein AMTR_s00076p00174050 [Amborella trichopoda]